MSAELWITRGATKTFRFRLKDSKRRPQNISGMTFSLCIKAAPDEDAPVLAEVPGTVFLDPGATPPVTIADAVVDVYFDPVHTDEVPAEDEYWCDMWAMLGSARWPVFDEPRQFDIRPRVKSVFP